VSETDEERGSLGGWGGCGTSCFVSNTGVSWTMKQGPPNLQTRCSDGWASSTGYLEPFLLRSLVISAKEIYSWLPLIACGWSGQPQRCWTWDVCGRLWNLHIFPGSFWVYILETGWGYLVCGWETVHPAALFPQLGHISWATAPSALLLTRPGVRSPDFWLWPCHYTRSWWPRASSPRAPASFSIS
jgi:hypothetical protein